MKIINIAATTCDLSAKEQADLERCEGVINRGQTAFLEVGEALSEVKEKRLYRGGYDTFNAYCKDRWDFTRSYGYRLIAAANLVKDVSPTGDIEIENERTARAVARLPKERRVEVIKQAVAAAGSNKLTTAAIRQVQADLDVTATSQAVQRPKEKAPGPFTMQGWVTDALQLAHKTRADKRLIEILEKLNQALELQTTQLN